MSDVYEFLEDKPIVNRYIEVSCKTGHKIDKLITLMNKYTQTKIEQNTSSLQFETFQLNDISSTEGNVHSNQCKC